VHARLNLLPVEWLLGKQRLVHPIHQMYAGVCKTLALLGDIEIPSGARVRQAGDNFAQVMHAVLPAKAVHALPGRRADHDGDHSRPLLFQA